MQIEDETWPARATQPSLSVGVGKPAVSQRALALPERPQADHVLDRNGAGLYLGDKLADSPGLARAADLTTKAATSAPTEGRVMYAGMRTLPVPSDPVARLWHSATMLREHRCDGHAAALVSARIGGTEAHVLSALELGIHPPESFGRIHHLPRKRLAEVMDGLRERGLVDTDGRFTDAGRETKQRIEALTDELAAPPYGALSPVELDDLIAELEPITATLVATGSQ